MIGSLVICIPILVTYKESYNRLDLDTIVITDEDDVLASQMPHENGGVTAAASAAASAESRRNIATDATPLLS